MKIRDSVALVTGANRGLGLVFAKELLAAGAERSMLRREIQNPSSWMESSR